MDTTKTKDAEEKIKGDGIVPSSAAEKVSEKAPKEEDKEKLGHSKEKAAGLAAAGGLTGAGVGAGAAYLAGEKKDQDKENPSESKDITSGTKPTIIDETSGLKSKAADSSDMPSKS